MIPDDNTIILYYMKYYTDREEEEDYIDISIQRIDLVNYTVLPGLQDAHLHVLETGKKLCSFNCNNTTLSNLNNNLKLYLQTKNNPEYIIGYNWIQDNWGRYPNKNDLLNFNIPIVLFRVCLHVCVVNDIVLQRAGIDKNTVDPVGGIIDRDEDGNPTGVLREKAIDLVRSFINESMEVRESYIKAGLKLCLENGITSVQTNDSGAWLAYKSLADKNELPCRVYLTIKASEILTHPNIIPYANENKGQLLSSHRAKLFADGALGASTAAISVPYVHRCGGQHCNKGILLYDYDAFVTEIKLAMDNGFRLEIHVIGDRAAEVTLDALEKLGNQDRPILTHCQVLRDDLMVRMNKLGVVANIQPTFVTTDAEWVADRLSEDLLKGSYAWQTLIQNDIVCAGGSDTPIEHPNCMLGMHAAMFRYYKKNGEKLIFRPDQQLSFAQALWIYTTGAAWAAHTEDILGQLRPGMKADFVVISEDVKNNPELLEICMPKQVWVNGVKVL